MSTTTPDPERDPATDPDRDLDETPQDNGEPPEPVVTDVPTQDGDKR
jgi:hypothetical protein